jgi:hypothetical protein
VAAPEHRPDAANLARPITDNVRAGAAANFSPDRLENPGVSAKISAQGGLVHPSTLTAGFTFSLPSSWEDGPIEVRNFNRIRKVYSQVRDNLRSA